ncbi:MAG: PH domain-containing protein [Thermoplasmata archaeon]|nr:PH domain-containing protein [Thermoplasmata archaeon]
MSTQAAPPRTKYLREAYLANGEEIRAESRTTKFYYFPGPLLALLIVGLLDYAAAAAKYTWLPAMPGLTRFFGALPAGGTWTGATFALAFLLLLTLGALILLGLRYLEWTRTVYAVTSSRVIIQKGVFSREFEEIPIRQVRGIEIHQTFLHRVLGYGTLRLSSEGGARIGNEKWAGLPNPFRFQRAIETESQAISRGQSPPMNPPVTPAAAPPVAPQPAPATPASPA